MPLRRRDAGGAAKSGLRWRSVAPAGGPSEPAAVQRRRRAEEPRGAARHEEATGGGARPTWAEELPAGPGGRSRGGAGGREPKPWRRLGRRDSASPLGGWALAAGELRVGPAARAGLPGGPIRAGNDVLLSCEPPGSVAVDLCPPDPGGKQGNGPSLALGGSGWLLSDSGADPTWLAFFSFGVRYHYQLSQCLWLLW